ncbi:uncharacterized protein PG986_006385 [Apiospora aurea]|uniref:Uncharacterized protein n=1 Tax=Apiospora aurea TaxID=335848 RepID=A0ABR1QKN0_9PEZI
MSLCRAVVRRLPACRPASIGAACFYGTRPNNTATTNRPFHTAPLLNKKQTNPVTSEQEKVRHSEPSPVGRENIGAKRFADFELAGKVFVVTGGAQGLGLALAEALVEAGGKVYCVDRSPEPDEQWRQAQERVVPEWGGSLHYRQQDVSDTAHLDQLMQAIADESGRLDGLVAAAAIQQVTPATEYSAHDARDMLAVNYTGVLQACTAAARQMLARRTRGTVVIVASMSGLVANKGLLSPVYNSSKAALIQLARNLAMEWSPINQEGSGGIRVNCISPGHILTPMVKKNFEEVPGLREKWEKENMMGRLAETSEFKGAVLFLSSKASSFMTGGNLLIDGGHTQW